MRGEALFREHGKQVAALCWRHSPKRGSQLEVLLITSLNSKRWIMPKGWPEPDLSPAENAAREAFEEAGVTGKISPQPIGSYHYLKERKDGGGVPCSVEVFALAVTKQLGLPTFEIAGMTLIKRLSLVLRDGLIDHVFYPVFPPDRHAEEVLAWLASSVKPS